MKKFLFTVYVKSGVLSNGSSFVPGYSTNSISSNDDHSLVIFEDTFGREHRVASSLIHSIELYNED